MQEAGAVTSRSERPKKPHLCLWTDHLTLFSFLSDISGGRGGRLFTEVSPEVLLSHHHCTSPRLPPLDAPTSRNPSGGGGAGVTHLSPRSPPFPTRHCVPGAPEFPEPQNAKHRSQCQEPGLKAESGAAPLPSARLPLLHNNNNNNYYNYNNNNKNPALCGATGKERPFPG